MKTILKCILWSLFAFISVVNVYGKGVGENESAIGDCIVSANATTDGTQAVTTEKANVLIRFGMVGGGTTLSSFAELSQTLSKDVSIYINGWIGSVYLSGTMIVKAGERTSPVVYLADHVDPSSGYPKIDMVNISPKELIGNVRFE